jgi:hypothetical protein
MIRIAGSILESELVLERLMDVSRPNSGREMDRGPINKSCAPALLVSCNADNATFQPESNQALALRRDL